MLKRPHDGLDWTGLKRSLSSTCMTGSERSACSSEEDTCLAEYAILCTQIITDIQVSRARMPQASSTYQSIRLSSIEMEHLFIAHWDPSCSHTYSASTKLQWRQYTNRNVCFIGNCSRDECSMIMEDRNAGDWEALDIECTCNHTVATTPGAVNGDRSWLTIITTTCALSEAWFFDIQTISRFVQLCLCQPRTVLIQAVSICSLPRRDRTVNRLGPHIFRRFRRFLSGGEIGDGRFMKRRTSMNRARAVGLKTGFDRQ